MALLIMLLAFISCGLDRDNVEAGFKIGVPAIEISGMIQTL